MAENWTCHVCETICDGEVCPICGAAKTNRVFAPPPMSSPPMPPPPLFVEDDDGDDEWSEVAKRERLKHSMKQRALLYYTLFLVLGIPAAWQALRDLAFAGEWASSLWDWFIALTPGLLVTICTIAFKKTINNEENAEAITLSMFTLALLDGMAYLLYIAIRFNVVFDPTFELFVPIAVLACLFFYALSRRMQKL